MEAIKLNYELTEERQDTERLKKRYEAYIKAVAEKNKKQEA